MTITRHDVTASTSDLVPHSNPAIGRRYWRTDPFPTWADPAASATGWSPIGAHTTAGAADAEGVPVLEHRVITSNASTVSRLMHAAPGVQPGRTYRVSVMVYNPTTRPLRASIDLTGRGAIAEQSGEPLIPPDAWVEVWAILDTTAVVEDRFVFLELRREFAGPGIVAGDVLWWSTVQATPTTLTDVLELHPTDATITLDESWTPYARAALVCPLPPADVLDRIDPRVSPAPRVRVQVRRAAAQERTLADMPAIVPATTLEDLSTAFAGMTLADVSELLGDPYEDPARPDLSAVRTFDLQLRARTVDWVAGTMTLDLTSDEMSLQDFARFETITTRLTPPTTTSLATLVRWGVGLIGGTFDAGTVLDAVIDSTTVIWNLGEELWDFLDGHVRAANRRLWCDEDRRWRLTEPLTGTSGDPVVITRPKALVDTLSRDPSDGYGDANVVIYQWTDAEGAQQRAYGYSYQSFTQPVTRVQRWPNQVGTTPQAQAASSALQQRIRSRGRAVVVEDIADPATTPGRPLTVAGTAAPVTDAMVSAVTFAYPADRMTIRTRDAATT